MITLKLSICVCLLFVKLTVGSATLDPSIYKLEDLNDIFGSMNCVRGDLATMGQHPPSIVEPELFSDLRIIEKAQMTAQLLEEMMLHANINLPIANINLPNANINLPNIMGTSRDVSGGSAMSRVNDLAVFNEIENQYRLIAEHGPAHDKRWTVALQLGTEEYTAERPSIKTAQQAVAAKAMQYTAYPSRSPESRKASKKSCNDKYSGKKELVDSKSPVSMVYEMGTKYSFHVAFELKSESGPPHKKTFVTSCSAANFLTEGSGSSKKTSKQQAATFMLEKLKMLPSVKNAQPQTEECKPRKKKQRSKKRNRNLIKEIINTNEKGSNQMSRLWQWSKKLVKNLNKGSSTQKMLGGLKESTTNPLNMVKSSSEALNEDSSCPTGRSLGRQLVSGLMMMQDQIEFSSESFDIPTHNGVNPGKSEAIPEEPFQNGMPSDAEIFNKHDVDQRTDLNVGKTAAAMKKKLVEAEMYPNIEALAKRELNRRIGSTATDAQTAFNSATNFTSSSKSKQVMGPRDQLFRLAELLSLKVQFSNIPMEKNDDFLSLVSLSSNPPILCRGGGSTPEQSIDQSAHSALEYLGWDSVTTSAIFSPSEKREIG